MKAIKFSQFLQSREELKFVDRPHWIYVLEAAIWSIITIGVGFFVHNFIANSFIYHQLENNIHADGFLINIAAYVATACLWGSILIATVYFLSRLVFWSSTYVFASDRRLYMKTGLIRVLVNEVSFEEIRKTDINYGLLGRFLGYGKLMMDARFVEDSELPFVYHPELFAKLIHHENDLASDINLSYVTNNMTDDIEKAVPKKNETKDQVKSMRKQAEFVDYVFSKEERKELHDIQDEELLSDFDGAAETPNKELKKPASSSPKAIRA